MQSEEKNDYNYLVCFFIINKDNKISLANHYFEISSSSISISHKFSAFIKEINDVVQVKSVAIDDRKNSFVCLLFFDGSLKCFKFLYIHNGLFSYAGVFYELEDVNFHCKIDINGL